MSLVNKKWGDCHKTWNREKLTFKQGSQFESGKRLKKKKRSVGLNDKVTARKQVMEELMMAEDF